jgi:protein gp37
MPLVIRQRPDILRSEEQAARHYISMDEGGIEILHFVNRRSSVKDDVWMDITLQKQSVLVRMPPLVQPKAVIAPIKQAPLRGRMSDHALANFELQE